MPALPIIRNFNLKVIFLVHFIFISLSSMGSWVPSGYIFYNSILILLLLWGLYDEQSHDPIQLAIVVNGCSVVLDVLLLIMCFPDSVWAREKFSAALAILHLFVRPFSTAMLLKNLDERNGSTGILNGILSRHNESYEDIDRNVHQTSSNIGGYDCVSAEQI